VNNLAGAMVIVIREMRKKAVDFVRIKKL